MNDKLKQAKAEKEAYDKVYQEVWDEEVTDFDELRYMKFFKAGIEHAKERTDSEEVEKLKKGIEHYKDMYDKRDKDARRFIDDIIMWKQKYFDTKNSLATTTYHVDELKTELSEAVELLKMMQECDMDDETYVHCKINAFLSKHKEQS